MTRAGFSGETRKIIGGAAKRFDERVAVRCAESKLLEFEQKGNVPETYGATKLDSEPKSEVTRETTSGR
jgi:hypothetical protein